MLTGRGGGAEHVPIHGRARGEVDWLPYTGPLETYRKTVPEFIRAFADGN